VSQQGYDARVHEVATQVARLQHQRDKFKDVSWRAHECSEAIDAFDVFLKRRWAIEVAKHPLPQSYLYAAYERRFRFYKLFPMLIKLAIIVFTIFAPNSVWTCFKIVLALAVHGLFTMFIILYRPLHNAAENAMEITSHLAICVDLVAALGLKMEWLPSDVATLLLFIVNGVAVLVFACGLLSNSIRAGCGASRPAVAPLAVASPAVAVPAPVTVTAPVEPISASVVELVVEDVVDEKTSSPSHVAIGASDAAQLVHSPIKPGALNPANVTTLSPVQKDNFMKSPLQANDSPTASSMAQVILPHSIHPPHSNIVCLCLIS
jgi:hypothetical protein